MKHTLTMLLLVFTPLFLAACEEEKDSSVGGPAAFSLLSPSDGATTLSGTVALVWQNTTGEEGYLLEISTDASFSSTVYSVELPAGSVAHSVPHGTLSNGVKYYWRVFAFSGNIDVLATGSPRSFTPNTSIDFELISPPNGATDQSPLSVGLGWNPISGVTGFIVQIANDSSVVHTSDVLSSSTGSYTPPSGALEISTTYKWRVIAVTSEGGYAASNSDFSFTTADNLVPTITTVSPDSGTNKGGTTVTIFGTNFIAGDTTVTFDFTMINTQIQGTSVNVVSSTELTVVTPAASEDPNADVIVTTSNGSATKSGGYTFLGPPTIGTISPDNGPDTGGTFVTITGANFIAGDTTVQFRYVEDAAEEDKFTISGVTVNSTTKLTFTTPALSTGDPRGDYDVFVTTTSGTGEQSRGFDYNFTQTPSVTEGDSLFPTGPLVPGTNGHTATHLDGGMVLIAGGRIDDGPGLATASLYNPSTGETTITGPLSIPRRGHRATLLADGRVLITGGVDPTGSTVAISEIFDPATGRFTATGTLDRPRHGHTATRLLSGEVLITGGRDGEGILDGAEVFNPQTGAFSSVGSMNKGRHGHSATLLPSGEVLIAGGSSSTVTGMSSAELYSPSSQTFGPTGSLLEGRSGHAALDLTSGEVLLARGRGGAGPVSSREVYLPGDGNFTPFSLSSSQSQVALLSDGRNLVSHGFVEAISGEGGSISAVLAVNGQVLLADEDVALPLLTTYLSGGEGTPLPDGQHEGTLSLPDVTELSSGYYELLVYVDGTFRGRSLVEIK